MYFQGVTSFPSTLYIVTNVILLLFSELAFYLPWSMFTLIGIESVEKKNTFRPIWALRAASKLHD